MLLLKYFRKVTILPNPDSSLSDHVPSAAIASANKEVRDLVVRESDVPDTTGGRKKRSQYLSYTDKEKARIRKRASEFGVINTLRYFSKEFADCPLKESTVTTWMTAYKKEVAVRFRLGESSKIEKLAEKKRGHPFLLGEELLWSALKEIVFNPPTSGNLQMKNRLGVVNVSIGEEIV